MAQARAVLDLGDAFTARLSEVGAAELLHDMELPTSELLARMERHGIAADRAHLEAMEQQFAGAVQQAVKEAHAAVGHEFNLGSPKQLQEVLFGELGLPKTKKTKTGYTTDADALAWLAAQTEHELPVIMLRHREQARLRVHRRGPDQDDRGRRPYPHHASARPWRRPAGSPPPTRTCRTCRCARTRAGRSAAASSSARASSR